MEVGDSEKVFKNAAHPYTLALISAAPSLSTTAKKRIYLPSVKANAGVGCPFAGRCFMAQDVCFTTFPPFIAVEKGHFAACHFATMEKREKLAKAALKNQEKESE